LLFMQKNLSNFIPRLKNKLRLESYLRQNNLRIWQLTRKVTATAKLDASQAPVAFFNASTRLYGVSLNAAFSFLTALGLQLAGTPVVHFACGSGMSRCVLGTNRDDVSASPPCRRCTAQSRWLYANAPTMWFGYQQDESLRRIVEGQDVPCLSELEYQDRPLGALVLPGLRWVLRRHHLVDDEPTRMLLREFILSAHNVAEEFDRFLTLVEPQAVVLFNGMMAPEAAAGWVARRKGIRVITHEVGLQPFTAFFTDGDATAYPIDIPDDFELSPEQEALLDAYLEQRFQGKFSMAGIQFWPQMEGLSEIFLEKAARFKQTVPVFTNVIFDTSQAHANRLFPHMFAWLDHVLEAARRHTDTLFVIRAHPDESRRGKESRESVEGWVRRTRADELHNVVFIPPAEYLSSYELIQRSKFVMVYNSSIGLEASLMGAAVLCAGKARYTQLDTVYFPQTQQDYLQKLEELLGVSAVEAPEAHRRNARRFLFYQLFKASLPFSDFLEPSTVMPGFVTLRRFHWQRLTPDLSLVMHIILEGVLHGKAFLIDEKEHSNV
jgi:hypothetical protein